MTFGLSRAKSRSCRCEVEKNVGHCRESNSCSLAVLPLHRLIGLLTGSCLRTSETNMSLYYRQRLSPYRAVNTLRLGYTNQSVNAVQGNNRRLFSYPHKTHKYTVSQNVGLLNVKLVVHIVTTGFLAIKRLGVRALSTGIAVFLDSVY